ncbi:MAG TPA: deoxyribodipyrimidine photolyase [candidate division Zixibacteria bacterium]|nr:deoxyribodipyrimidine photolyase [candidate division Zixibacteria bacterium]
MTTPDIRIRALNAAPPNPDGFFVLYWMIANRRLRHNFALERAVELANERGKPLVILEALGVRHPWATARAHRFILDGIAERRATLQRGPATYYPYCERSPGEARGLLAALAQRAVAVITDDNPSFIYPKLLRRAARELTVRLEAVDSNGLSPLAEQEKAYTSAYQFRRFLQKTLPARLLEAPAPEPLTALRHKTAVALDKKITQRWPALTAKELGDLDTLIAGLPLDHSVAPTALRGGETAAREALALFLSRRLDTYDERRNYPAEAATSGLSPYLHFGMISTHEIVAAVATAERWQPGKLSESASGARAGWWGMSDGAEAFLDQLVTWRELGFNMCAQRHDYDQYSSLPEWAQATLSEHARDPRPYRYSLEDFELARTHDELWNAAQRQLVREGVIHNYLRMLWGKKILHWSKSPRTALGIMIELNNKYALDGRDPNSYSGIFWILGRYDRPWGPEREIFGTVRYMTSENTARKFPVREYLARYAERAQAALL